MRQMLPDQCLYFRCQCKVHNTHHKGKRLGVQGPGISELCGKKGTGYTGTQYFLLTIQPDVCMIWVWQASHELLYHMFPTMFPTGSSLSADLCL